MATLPVLPPEARRILELARNDRAAARGALAKLTPDAQAALLLETPVSRRVALLDLLDEPERVVPALPAADVCLMARAIGLEEAGWLLACATEEQLQASVDLDAWNGYLPDRGRFSEWMSAFLEAGEETVLRAIRAVDFEVWVLQLRERAFVTVKTSEDDWEPPAGGLTIDGVFWFVPRTATDDLSDLIQLLRTLFSNEYWVYFRLAQGGVWEDSDMESEEWAHRWRRGRLQDLGFPDLEDASRIYSFLRAEHRSELPSEWRPAAAELGSTPAISAPQLPTVHDSEHALFRAMAGLDEAERAPVRSAFLALANRVAMADELPLGEPETLDLALEKAARVASRGLLHLGHEHGMEGAAVLRRVPVERLFRVGHNLEPEPPPRPADPGADRPAD